MGPSAQVARGVAACHKMKCAHRDLKSLNVLACADSSKASGLILKISDFGESKDVGAQTARLPHCHVVASHLLSLCDTQLQTPDTPKTARCDRLCHRLPCSLAPAF